MIDLKDYQEKAIEKLKSETNELLDSTENKICVFKSPTGSGKTLMVAEYLKRLVRLREDNKKLSFIWISVNKLHDQSKDSLEKYYEDTRIELFARRKREGWDCWGNEVESDVQLIAKSKTQGATPSFNKGLKVRSGKPHSPKLSPTEITSPNPNIKLNKGECL